MLRGGNDLQGPQCPCEITVNLFSGCRESHTLCLSAIVNPKPMERVKPLLSQQKHPTLSAWQSQPIVTYCFLFLLELIQICGSLGKWDVCNLHQSTVQETLHSLLYTHDHSFSSFYTHVILHTRSLTTYGHTHTLGLRGQEGRKRKRNRPSHGHKSLTVPCSHSPSHTVLYTAISLPVTIAGCLMEAS